MFWGDHHARVSDKHGNILALTTHMEDLTPDEMQQRQDAFVKAQQTQHSQG